MNSSISEYATQRLQKLPGNSGFHLDQGVVELDVGSSADGDVVY